MVVDEVKLHDSIGIAANEWEATHDVFSPLQAISLGSSKQWQEQPLFQSSIGQPRRDLIKSLKQDHKPC